MAKVTNLLEVTGEGAIIDKMIAKVGSMTDALRDHVNVCAMSCTLHMIKHGDPVYINRMITAMGEGWRLNALRDWFVKFAPVRYVKVKDVGEFKIADDKRVAAIKEDFDRKGEAAYIQAMRELPFYKFKPESEYKPINTYAAVHSLIARHDKLMAGEYGDDAKNHEDNHLAGIDELRAWLASVQPKAKRAKLAA